MFSKHVANCLNFFTKSLALSDQEDLTTMLEDYFTVNSDEEDEVGKLIPVTTIIIHSYYNKTMNSIIFLLNEQNVDYDEDDESEIESEEEEECISQLQSSIVFLMQLVRKFEFSQLSSRHRS